MIDDPVATARGSETTANADRALRYNKPQPRNYTTIGSRNMREHRSGRISFWRFGISLMIPIVFSVCWCFSSLAQSQSLNQSATQASANANTAVTTELRRAADLLQSGNLDKAEPIIRHVLASNPNNADAHNLLGAVMDQRGKSEAAEREYRTSLRLNPNSLSAMANLGVLLARTGRADEAIKTFESVLRSMPDHPQATVNLGFLYANRGDDARAISLLQRAITLGFDSYEVRYRLGVSLYNLKRFDESR